MDNYTVSNARLINAVAGLLGDQVCHEYLAIKT
jgi:hypothetical protein